MTTETKRNDRRDLQADLALCREVTESYPNAFVMHYTDVMCENPPGSCDLDAIAWASAPKTAKFIAQAHSGWPHSIERALSSEAKWVALRAIVETNATGRKYGADLNDWDIVRNEIDALDDEEVG